MKKWNITINGGNNQFAETIYNGQNVTSNDQKLIDIINSEISNESDKKQLIDDLLSMKSNEGETNEPNDSSKKRVGKFLDAGISEAGKVMVRDILESAPEYFNVFELLQ